MVALVLIVLNLALGSGVSGAESAASTPFRVVEDSGLPSGGATFGGTWAHLDADGLPDLVLSRHGNENVAFFRNEGDLRFTVLEPATRPTGLRDHHGTAACDDDADGVWDLFLSGGADRGQGSSCKQLWRHDGSMGFVADGCEHLLADPGGRGRGALWLQLAPAELPSLLLLNFDSPPRLFGREDGHWADRGGDLRFPDSTWTRARESWIGAATADLDGDGAPDLVTTGLERHVWRNTGSGLELAIDTGLAAIGPPVADFAAGDLDGDGDADLVLVLAAGVIHVLRNESRPGEIRFSQPVPPDSWPRLNKPVSCAMADLDNDGRLDLVVARRGPRNSDRAPVLLLGTGDCKFDPPAAPTGLTGVPSRAMAILAVDADADGDLDLVAFNGEEVVRDRPGAVMVYENLAANRGLTMELTAAANVPPHALGAVVTLEVGGRRQTRQVRSIANPWNSTVPALHFGTGRDAGPYSVTVDWPSGRRQTVTLPAAGAAYRLVEGQDEATRLGRAP